MSKRKGKPKGAPDYSYKSEVLGMDARPISMTELKKFHKWLTKYINYWKDVK